MKTTVTQEEFEAFLNLLDSDREKAGLKYEEIRHRLMRVFYARGCPPAEELADESIDRAIKKIYQMTYAFEGDPALYCYRVAGNVFLEFTRKPKFVELKEVEIVQIQKDKYAEEQFQLEIQLNCLNKCLRKLHVEDRRLIESYYRESKNNKIKEKRRVLAEKHSTSVPILKVRILRLRKTLRLCCKKCIESSENA
jgi:hypothetical protein